MNKDDKKLLKHFNQCSEEITKLATKQLNESVRYYQKIMNLKNPNEIAAENARFNEEMAMMKSVMDSKIKTFWEMTKYLGDLGLLGKF